MSTRGREGRLAATKYVFIDELKAFIREEKGKFPKGRWIQAYGSELFVRHFKHPQHGDQLDLATITIRRENQHQGIFRSTLQEAEMACFANNYWRIKVENVFHPALQVFLERRGYESEEDLGGLISYYWLCSRGAPLLT